MKDRRHLRCPERLVRSNRLTPAVQAQGARVALRAPVARRVRLALLVPQARRVLLAQPEPQAQPVLQPRMPVPTQADPIGARVRRGQPVSPSPKKRRSQNAWGERGGAVPSFSPGGV
jgi:hypothetical protein